MAPEPALEVVVGGAVIMMVGAAVVAPARCLAVTRVHVPPLAVPTDYDGGPVDAIACTSEMSDEEHIRRLLARFVQLRDDKRFAEWSELFTRDGSFSYGSVHLEGRRAINDHVAELLADDSGKHQCFNSVIEVSGDSASVSSDFVKIDPLPGGGYGVTTMGRYLDDLVRDGGVWRIANRRVAIHGH